MLKQSYPAKLPRIAACLKSAKNKKNIFVHSIKIKLTIEELKAVAEIRGIKGFKSMSKNELPSALTLKKGKKPKTSFSKAKIEKIRKEFHESRYKFSKLKIKEI